MPDTITAPGIYRGFTEADYFADPCPEPSLTQSIAKVLLDQSPAHAKLEHPRLAPPAEEADETPEKYIVAQAIGNAAHARLIGRGKNIAECQFDSWRTDNAKKARAAAEAAGDCPILSKHLRIAEEMVFVARHQLGMAGLTSAFFDGDGEVVLAWQEDGLWFRSLVDWLEPDLLTVWDFKTTGLSVAPHALSKLMADAGWDLQAAMIERGLDALAPADAGRRRFRFVAQENAPPFALAVCELTEGVLTMGRKKLAMAIDIWRRCMATGEWPAYPLGIQYPEYPGWKETQWLDREMQFEEHLRKVYRVTPDHLMAG